MLEFNLLGIPRLTLDDETVPLPSPKNLALLAYLALQSNAVTRKELLELFWDAGKSSNVRFALFKLRDLPESQTWLETKDQFVRATIATDVARFEQAVKENRFGDALDIWHEGGESDKLLLKGLALDDAGHFMTWLELERTRLEALYLKSLQKGVEKLEQQGQYEDALDLAYILLEKDKLDETAHRAVMRLEHRRGDIEAALAQFEQCREILSEELGVEPLADTLGLLREIEGGGLTMGKRALLAKSSDELPAQTETLIGRAGLVATTETALLEQGRVLLHGFGGVGKTALAAEIAKRHLAACRGRVLWLQAGDDPPENLFDAAARAFDAQQQLGSDLSERARALGSLLAEQELSLFVLDDVWNAYALSKMLEVIPASLPVLITSRQRYPRLQRLDVGRLTREAGLELLSFHAQTDLSDDPGAKRLCELLGDHAYALRVAGINLCEDGLSAAALAKHITDAPHSMKTPSDFSEAGTSISSLLTTSLNALSEEAYEAFMGFGVLFTTSSTPELLALCTRRSEEDTEQALFALQKRGLAERVSEPGSDLISYRVHDLAYSFARENSHYRLATVQRACETFLERHKEAFGVLDADIDNILGAMQAASELDDAYLIAMMERLVAGNAYFGARGHSPRSFELLKRATVRARILGDTKSSCLLLAKLANTYREIYGDYQAALSAYQDALDLTRINGDTHQEVVILTLIGTTLVHMGSDEAEGYLELALKLATRRADDQALCQVLEHLGVFAGKRGDFETSCRYFSQALQATERLARGHSVPEAELARLRFFSLLNLGEAEKGRGNVAEALAIRNRALAVAERLQNQLWMAYAYHELGETYHDLAERDQAQARFDRALDLYERNRASSALAALRDFMTAERYSVAVSAAEPRNALQTPTG